MIRYAILSLAFLSVFTLTVHAQIRTGACRWMMRMVDAAHSCGAVAESHGVPVFIP